MALILEKGGCDHVKAIDKLGFAKDVDTIKNLSRDVSNKSFLPLVWDKGGRKVAAVEAETYRKKVRFTAF